jgi:lipopolysaccharide transport system permease protein
MVELFLFLAGVAFLLSAVTPFFRDTKDFVTVFMNAGVYLIPAFYLPAWVPQMFRPVIGLNPFSYPIWVCQDIFYYGRFEHPRAWLVFFLMALISFIFGYRVFRRIRPFIASVL